MVFLKDIGHCIVHYCERFSNSYSLLSRVPQGSILGPLLFTIFFNDIAVIIKHNELLNDADDTVIYVASKDASSINKT